MHAETWWVCSRCGHRPRRRRPPARCSRCGSSRIYFIALGERPRARPCGRGRAREPLGTPPAPPREPFVLERIVHRALVPPPPARLPSVAAAPSGATAGPVPGPAPVPDRLHAPAPVTRITVPIAARAEPPANESPWQEDLGLDDPRDNRWALLEID